MKIAILGHKRVPSREGGVEVAVTELSRRLAALGHRVTCYNRGDRTIQIKEMDGVRVKTVPTVAGKGLAAASAGFFAAVCSGFSDAEVVHIHGEGPAFFCWLPRFLGKRVVVTIHGLDWQREKWRHSFGKHYIRWGEKMAVRYAHEIIVLSRSAQRYFRDAYGRGTVYIPNGICKPDWAEPKEIRDAYGLGKDDYLLFLGRLVPEKGIHHLLRAFRQVDTEKKLVIAGQSSDSDAYVEQLRALAAKDERVLFTGFVQGRILQELYSNAYLYVLPSSLEGMPIGLLEAMSYGNCCLVSDIPECMEVLGTCGVPFPAGEEAALKEKLQILCDDSEMVRNRRANAENLPGWDEVVKRTLELYR